MKRGQPTSRVGVPSASAALLILLAVLPAEAQDAKAGKALAGQICQTCHGLDGIAQIPIAPHLAAESAIYLQTQLKAFKSGKREHEMMSIVAQGLSDKQIADVAAWYESIKITATVPE